MPAALLTGVGRPNGIAAAAARALAADGWDLGLHWYDEDPSHLKEELAVRVALHRDDLADAGAPARTFDALSAELGAFDALLLVHTRCVAKGLLDTTAEELDLHFATNVRAAMLMIQLFAAQLQSPEGRIIALTSDHFTPENLAYGTSKAALDRVVLAAAHELGPRGISANCINPGPNDTGWMTPEIYEDAKRKTPLGRVGLPEDAARLARFLCSPAGGWVSGQVLYSNGAFRLNV
ncbi:MAG TPA: SDR family oxidoreductase [Candidatus Dormibacteraeota bacterium]|jgi:3-oxoacyl-[acyl-carrier protein] reductase|nr:SDR family oxidoreductase [Candidatus Dormibacteraeota bacterium]